jgi:hypothetical protein
MRGEGGTEVVFLTEIPEKLFQEIKPLHLGDVFCVSRCLSGLCEKLKIGRSKVNLLVSVCASIFYANVADVRSHNVQSRINEALDSFD